VPESVLAPGAPEHAPIERTRTTARRMVFTTASVPRPLPPCQRESECERECECECECDGDASA
jgi:hypothetical protein